MRINRAGSAGGTAWLVPSPGFASSTVRSCWRPERNPRSRRFRTESNMRHQRSRHKQLFEFISGEHIDAPSMQLDRGSRDGTDARWL